jgi:hypothetical protein
MKALHIPVLKIVLTENYHVRQYYVDSHACPITFVANILMTDIYTPAWQDAHE